MAESKIPATFKALTPFIRRAEELERDSTRPESKLIAYYCRQYAMEMGIKLRENDSSNDATNFLLALMDRLEDDKQKLPAFTQDEGKEICEDFALEIFAKADDEDRAGCADKNTARTFYAAGTFFDILNQFGEPSEDIFEKRKYCKYKAATILKAIKEGTAPVPGPPGVGYATSDGFSDDQPMKQEAPSVASSSSFSSLPSTPSFPSPPVAAPSPPTPQPVKSAPPAFPSFTSSASSFGPSGVNNWSPPPVASAPPPEPKYTPPPPAYTPPAPQPMYAPPAPPSHPVMPPAPTSYVPQTLPARNASKPVSQAEINDAMECAKFAVAALKVKDIELAIQRLEMALRAIK